MKKKGKKKSYLVWLVLMTRNKLTVFWNVCASSIQISQVTVHKLTGYEKIALENRDIVIAIII